MDDAAHQPARSPFAKPVVSVVAGLIVRDSRVLICQRRRDDSHGLKWEFPGGKVEPGETPSEALRRELREELGVEARIGKEVFRTRHLYNKTQSPLELIFLQASVDRFAKLENLAFERFEWADPSALPGYDFLEADKEFVALLASGSIHL